MGYSRLEPGRELEVREYISFQRGRDGFCELIECSVDELLERKAESIVREKNYVSVLMPQWKYGQNRHSRPNST